MTEVVIAGIGQTPVGEHWDTTLRALAVRAMRAAVADAGGLKPDILLVGNVFAPQLSHQAHLGALLADFAGFAGIEAETLEAGGASGGAALRQGYLAILSGLADVALVVGVEKPTDMLGPEVEEALATSTDSDYEAVHGLTATAQSALLAGRYLHEFGVPADGLAGFPLTAHANGAGNKNAMYHNGLNLKTYQAAEMVCAPLNLFDLAPLADGAAAVVLTRRDMLPKGFPHPIVRIAASASVSDSIGLHDRPDPLVLVAAQKSVEAALKKAGLSREQVDLFEYHDTASILAALVLEAVGFAKRGQGWKLAADGSIARTGQIPCATMGGSKARGEPHGATGVYQAVEATLQLRGQAGTNQIAGAKVAMIQALAGPASMAVTHILDSGNSQFV